MESARPAGLCDGAEGREQFSARAADQAYGCVGAGAWTLQAGPAAAAAPGRRGE